MLPHEMAITAFVSLLLIVKLTKQNWKLRENDQQRFPSAKAMAYLTKRVWMCEFLSSGLNPSRG